MAVVAVLLVAAIGGGYVWLHSYEPRKGTFCTPALPIREVDGRTVAIQEQDPGGTDCAVGRTTPGMATLGKDCKVRAPNGAVVDTVKSSRKDGTCGFESPAP